MTKQTRSLATLVGVALITIALSVLVGAHAHLDKTEPADGATLRTPPEHVQLFFNSKVDVAVSTIEVMGPNGKVSLGDVHGMDEDKTLMAVVKGDMTNGGYTATWQTAAADGHPAKGSFAFILNKTTH